MHNLKFLKNQIFKPVFMIMSISYHPSEKSNLEEKLIKYSDTTSTQIVVAIISSTKGENINYLGATMG